MKPRVVVIGSSNTDLVLQIARLPGAGETVMGNDLKIHAGGKGANQAVAAARAGAKVTFVASIGSDAFGEESMKRLEDEGIDTRWVQRDSRRPSGVALILKDPRGDNIIGVAAGSNNDLTAQAVRGATAAIREAGCVVAQLEVPLNAVKEAARLASAFGVPMLLNPAPALRLAPELFACLTVLTPNQGELAHLTGRRLASRAQIPDLARQLRQKGVAHVIVTCGSHGVCWCSDFGHRWFAPPRVKAIDSVGAGDCFSGALACSMARGESMAGSIEFAVAASAICVTRDGAQPSMPRRREILEQLARSGASTAD